MSEGATIVPMSRSTVLMLFGGESSEHEVSLSSARNVYAAIDKNKYEVLLGYIDRNGHWWLLDELSDELDLSGVDKLTPELGEGGFSVSSNDDLILPDVILPILHGKNGEDGTVQGLAGLMHIPIAGCNLKSSAIGMDKLAAKRIADEVGVRVVPYAALHAGDKAPDYEELAAKLSPTLFVKPNEAGSSVGVSKVESGAEFASALEEALRHGEMVLIEKAVKARELEIAVLGDYPDIQASVVGEIIPEGEFYSYESKYASGSTSRVVIPADIPTEVSQELTDWALRIYKALGCGGLSRIDFFLDDENNLYFNEINTMPGFTNISMYPKLWQASGLEYPELIDRLISMRLTKE